MARPPLPVGAHGIITAREIKPGLWEARCKYKHLDGVVGQPAKRGRTEAASIRNLQAHLTTLTVSAAKGDITLDSRFADIAERWIQNDIVPEVDAEVLSPNTLRTYRSVLKNIILPRFKALRLRECGVSPSDSLIKDTRAKKSYETASTVRTVLAGAWGYAVRHGKGIETNPIRSTSRLRKSPGDKKPVVALRVDQIGEVLTGLGEYAVQRQRDSKGRRVGARSVVWSDLPDLVEAGLSTGVRIGEALAVDGGAITRGSDGRVRVAIDWHIIRVAKVGLVRRPLRKGNRPGVTLIVPRWSESMWLRRKLASGGGPVFACSEGTWLDPSNTSNRLRAALDSCGYHWVTNHVFRKTVGTAVIEAGGSHDDAADQLGNTPGVVREHYEDITRKTNASQAAALESLRPSRKSIG